MITHTGVTVFVEVVDDDISVKAINDPPREGVLIEASGGTCNVGAQASIFLTWEVAKALMRGIERELREIEPCAKCGQSMAAHEFADCPLPF